MSIFAGMLAAAGALCAAEEKYFAPFAAAKLGAHLPKKTALNLPPAYGAVLLVNLVGATFTLIALGMRVGKARKQFKVEVRGPQLAVTALTTGNATRHACAVASGRPLRRIGAHGAGIVVAALNKP